VTRPVVCSLLVACFVGSLVAADRPNILFCISDDQSYAHAGANGDPVVKTPAFDLIARDGIRFRNAFCDAPTCGPSRSAILTGQPIWRLEQAGNIHSTLPAKFATYTEMLEDAGYFVGFTGKGWSPGRLEPGGRSRNPAGREFSQRRIAPPVPGVANKDYAGNFDDFLAQRPDGKPFCFWLGTHEPHRGFKAGSGVESGKDPSKVIVPPYLPDHEIVREDILDYYVEIEHFDQMVGRALESLEKTGDSDNTIVVVTSDHGMPFPRAKASLYDAGTHVPLAIRWPDGINSPGRASASYVSLSDLAPTFLVAAGLKPDSDMIARSLISEFTLSGPVLQEHAGDASFIAMERHDGCRRGGKGFPCRAIRTEDFLFILNYEPDRWPAGDPDASVCARAIPYGEVDSSPTKQLLMDNATEPAFRRFHDLAFARRPAEELYDLAEDPGQIHNVAESPKYAETKLRLRERLERYLVETKDPRALGQDAPWDYYPYYGVRKNKNWQVDEKP
jgi:N-sulfoglucosamine sulfohydrolase